MKLSVLIQIVSLLTVAVNADQYQSNNALYRCGIRKRFGAQFIHHAATAELGQWPWHAAVYHRIDLKKLPNEEYKCGATLIDQHHVLTSAHCVIGANGQSLKPHQLVIHLGKHELYKFNGQLQIVNVSEVHIHQDYSRNRHDVALLVLDSVVRYSEFVVPICLEPVPGGKADDLVGQRGWVAGWGVNENGTLSEVLKTTDMPVVEITECARSDPNLFGRFVSQAVFCASDRNGTSVCLGDSGGGMYFSVGDRWELRGIVSFGSQSETGSCDTSKYIMFTNVAHYYPWIRNLTDGRIGPVNSVSKRISERKCGEYAAMARKQSNGVCTNVRSPHAVTIMNNGSLACFATVISELYVLTEASCRNDGELGNIPIGREDHVDIDQAIFHPLYGQNPRLYNLMLLRLKDPLQFSSRLLPACLANPATENLYDSLTVVRFIYGHYVQVDEDINAKAIPKTECNNLGNQTLPSEVCVQNNREEVHVILNSLFNSALLQTFNSRNCMFTILGLPYISKGDVQIYTRVASHVDWIELVVWPNEMEVVQESTTTVGSNVNLYNKYSHDFYYPE